MIPHEETILYNCAKNGHLRILKYLVEQVGFIIPTGNIDTYGTHHLPYHETTLLHDVLPIKDLEILPYLALFIDINILDQAQRTPLTFLAGLNEDETILIQNATILLELGAEPKNSVQQASALNKFKLAKFIEEFVPLDIVKCACEN